MSAVLVTKLLLVPMLIALVTLAGRRFGPVVAGWLSAFPVVSGPILLFIALQHGSAFTATAAVGTLTAVLAILVFGISYAWTATRFPWYLSLLLALLSYALAVLALSQFKLSLSLSALAVLLALWLAPKLYPTSASMAAHLSSTCLTSKAVAQHASGKNTSDNNTSGNDIWWRMIAGAILVLLVTHFSASMGPQLSGLLAMFPVMGSVLAAFSHRQSGPNFTIQLLRGMVLGYYAFSTFCLVLAIALAHFSIAWAFGCALISALLVQVGSRLKMTAQ